MAPTPFHYSPPRLAFSFSWFDCFSLAESVLSFLQALSLVFLLSTVFFVFPEAVLHPRLVLP